jgi:NAD(P)H dehydrogenase (quinone)
MNVLIVYAHPEPGSLNGSLKELAVSVLERDGHEVTVSDLYALDWKARVDREDFPEADVGQRLTVVRESRQAFERGVQSPDVVAEQQKLLWADAVLLHFPLWWFSMPAILKGWVERVFACGFAYGVGEHSDTHWGDRYGEGVFAGKRAMLVVTAGGWAEHYAERGINGPIEDLLFPINHGILYYPGFEVLPPFLVYRTDTMDAVRYAGITRDLEARLSTLFTAAPIPYRSQNGGDYDIPSLHLAPRLEGAGQQGLRLHTRAAERPGAPAGTCASVRAVHDRDQGVVQCAAPLDCTPTLASR